MIPRWRGRLFYGWRIVGAGFGLEVLIGALLFHAYGSYVVLMREEFGWSRTALLGRLRDGARRRAPSWGPSRAGSPTGSVLAR